MMKWMHPPNQTRLLSISASPPDSRWINEIGFCKCLSWKSCWHVFPTASVLIVFCCHATLGPSRKNSTIVNPRKQWNSSKRITNSYRLRYLSAGLQRYVLRQRQSCYSITSPDRSVPSYLGWSYRYNNCIDSIGPTIPRSFTSIRTRIFPIFLSFHIIQ